MFFFMVLPLCFENRDLVLLAPSEMHHFRVFICQFFCCFLRRRVDPVSGGGGGSGGRGFLRGWIWDWNEEEEEGLLVPSSAVRPTLPQFPAAIGSALHTAAPLYFFLSFFLSPCKTRNVTWLLPLRASAVSFLLWVCCQRFAFGFSKATRRTVCAIRAFFF